MDCTGTTTTHIGNGPNVYGAGQNQRNVSPDLRDTFRTNVQTDSRGHIPPLAERRIHRVSPPDNDLATLVNQVEATRQLSFGVSNREVVLVVGNTGAGKSTFINYMAGKTFRSERRALRANVVCDNPLFEVGHGKQACTSVPEVYTDNNSRLTFCDCPGFFDNRGSEFEVVNAVSLRCVAKESRQVKCVILCIEYASLISMRGDDMDKAIRRTTEFLGLDQPDSVFLLLTKAAGHIEGPEEALRELAQLSPFASSLLQNATSFTKKPLSFRSCYCST